jgi:hypothetical protein
MRAEGSRVVGSDAWPLLAVAYAERDGRGGDIATIRFLAGLIRRAEFTGAELRGALGRLQAAGLVDRLEDGTYHATEPVLAFLTARTHRRGARHDYEALKRFLGVHAEEGPVADQAGV